MKWTVSCLYSMLIVCSQAQAQELYVYTEPASNIPAKSVSARISAGFSGENAIYNRNTWRYTAGLLAGFSKKIMVHTGLTVSNMHFASPAWESFYVYGKYRFLSKDDIHKHFRMAVFVNGSYSRNPFHYEDISLMGDKSGVETGIVATQLWHKLAVSATLGHTQLTHQSRFDKVVYVPERVYQSFNYSLSAGYLLFPREYTSYNQVNLNLYAELIAQQTWPRRRSYHDLGTAVQLIFNSKTKLNLGYRFELTGTMQRMMTNRWQFTVERAFLNALSRRK